jgi:hypothetical protein
MPNSGLIAQYKFNEGTGTVVNDSSSNGNHGTIKGQNPHWAQRKQGFCLDFDGAACYVDCGGGPAFAFSDAVTLEAWVLPEAQPLTEAGILGKHYESYFLTFYSDGFCYWYINQYGQQGLGNYVKAPLSLGTWHHIAALYSGAARSLDLYVDGILRATRVLNPGSPALIQPSQNFLIGLNTSLSGFFQGLIDNVRIYNRVLSAGEISQHFQAGEKELEDLEYWPLQASKTISAGGVKVGSGVEGQVRIDTAAGIVLLESMFSYPGSHIGWNHLASGDRTNEPDWAVSVTQPAPSTLAIDAASQSYRVSRRLTIQGDTVRIEDRISNLRAIPTGFVIWNRLTMGVPSHHVLLPGSAANPSMYLPAGDMVVGACMEDNLSRLRFEPGVGVPANQARFRLTGFAVDAGKELTIAWTLYLLPKGASYFDLINRIRLRWNAHSRVDGPFALFDANPATNSRLNDPAALTAYFQQKKLRMVALNPWLDYDPDTFDHILSRSDYKTLMQSAIAKIKAADPEIKCLGSIETDWIAIDLDLLDPQGQIPRTSPHIQVTLSNAQTKIIDDANLPWKDSVKRDPAGNLTLEYYQRGTPLKPQWSLAVYPASGNYHLQFLLGQAQFLIEDVGTDGFYIDQFSQEGIRTYQEWDGWSADISEQTGEIATKCTDCSLVGIAARMEICNYALAAGKVVVANTWATSTAEQPLPIYRFNETWNLFDPQGIDISDFPDGTEPMGMPEIFAGNLASPIAFGTQAKQAIPIAKRLMKAVIAYLRHGMLYYHYHIEDIPPGQGAYGPINQMFPLTPVRLREGCVEGKERIITAVSGKYHWPHAGAPKLHLFDTMGEEIAPAGIIVSKTTGGWNVDVKIADWAQIVIMH